MADPETSQRGAENSVRVFWAASDTAKRIFSWDNLAWTKEVLKGFLGRAPGYSSGSLGLRSSLGNRLMSSKNKS